MLRDLRLEPFLELELPLRYMGDRRLLERWMRRHLAGTPLEEGRYLVFDRRRIERDPDHVADLIAEIHCWSDDPAEWVHPLGGVAGHLGSDEIDLPRQHFEDVREWDGALRRFLAGADGSRFHVGDFLFTVERSPVGARLSWRHMASDGEGELDVDVETLRRAAAGLREDASRIAELLRPRLAAVLQAEQSPAAGRFVDVLLPEDLVLRTA